MWIAGCTKVQAATLERYFPWGSEGGEEGKVIGEVRSCRLYEISLLKEGERLFRSNGQKSKGWEAGKSGCVRESHAVSVQGWRTRVVTTHFPQGQ